MLEVTVRNSAQLFDSMLFNLIKHQNRVEIETVAESINNTMNSLHHFNVLHSHGSIIEASETRSGQKARYGLTSVPRPEIEQDEVAEGRVKNFILQLLPRATLKRQVAGECGGHHGDNTCLSGTSGFKDKEFRTTNILQLIEVNRTAL